LGGFFGGKEVAALEKLRAVGGAHGTEVVFKLLLLRRPFKVIFLIGLVGPPIDRADLLLMMHRFIHPFEPLKGYL
jgi:hypothetical protein